MRIDSRDLIGLPVVTTSGRRLGKVLFLELNVEAHTVALYHIGARYWPPGGPRYAVAPRQVLAITAEQMTVSDEAVRESERDIVRVRQPVTDIAPVASRRE